MEKMEPACSKDDENRKSYDKVGRIYSLVKETRSVCDERFIINLLQSEGDINYRMSEGSIMVPNLLHIASHEPALVDMLLDFGADFTRKDNEGRTVVHQIIRIKATRHRKLLPQTVFEDKCIDSILAAHVKFNNSSNPRDDYGLSHFHAACMTNNAEAVEFFLKYGVDIDLAVNADSSISPLQTPIQLAVKYTCPDVVQVLLNYGANVYLKNADGFSPLHSIVERLVTRYEVTMAPRFVETLNIFIKFVVDNGIDNANAADDFGLCKLHAACILEDPTLVEDVLNEVTDIDLTVNFDSPVCPGFTALHFSAFSNVRIFKLLLENGANIDAKNAEGKTPFDLCVRYYTVEDIYSILFSKREWRKILLSDGETKLIDVVFAMKDFDEFVLFLNRIYSVMFTCVPFDSPLWPGYTFLHLAVLLTEKISDINNPWFVQDDTKMVVECLRRGADITMTDIKGSTALHLAFYMQKRDVVEYLLNQHDRTLNSVDENNLSHFHIACATGHLKSVELFLWYGVDVNSPVLSTFRWQIFPTGEGFFIVPGSTALHISVATANYGITRKLIKHGADVNVPDANGFTPVHRLLSKRDKAEIGIYGMLLSARNLKNSVTDCGLSHLHVACYFGHCSSTKKLLKLGADVNAPLTYKRDDVSFKDYDEFHFHEYGNPRRPLSFLSDYAGYTALHFSGHADDFAAASLLIQRNADLFAETDEGTSPLKSLLCSNLNKRDGFFAMLVKNQVLQASFEEKFGLTRLHLACHLADVKLVRTLINRGADVDAKVSSTFWIWRGFTPLHLTMRRAYEKSEERSIVDRLKKIIVSLMKSEADPLLVNDDDNTCSHMITPLETNLFESKSLNLFSAVSVIFENLQDFSVNPTNSQGMSLFHIACISLNVVAIENYLNHDVDVNQSIGHFSKNFPGCTPLHLVINCVDLSVHQSRRTIKSNTDTLSRIIDMLLDNGANINATNADGNTPLHLVHKLGASPRVFIEKFMSNGADVHAINVNGENPLGSLLNNSKAVNWDGIELFLKHGCDINMYNTVTQWGYIWVSLIDKLIETRRILDVNFTGRTVLHNVVSRPNGRFARYTRYSDIIDRIVSQGCDIDHEDDEGKTALHLAAIFDNEAAVTELLRAGADLNVIDKYGKSAFAYCKKIDLPSCDDTSYEERLIPHYVTKEFVEHAYKLEFCGQRVSEQNKRLRDEVLKNFALGKGTFGLFHAEMENAKGISIGSTSLTIYQFLTNDDMDIAYMDMTNEQRYEVDEFIARIGVYRLNQIDGLSRLKYRQTVKNTKLVEPALESFNALIKWRLPYLCCRNVLKFLQNDDLKRLIAATT